MIPGVCESIKELVAEKGVGKGTAAFVRKRLERVYSREVVHSKDVGELILQAIEDYVDSDQSEDDVDAPAYGRETSPRSTSSRALSIQTSKSGFSKSGIRRERSPARAASPKKDPDKPSIEEGVIWFGSERIPVSCCFSVEDVNYMGEHVLDNFKERDLLTAEIEEDRITLQFRKEGEARSILLEFEIRPNFLYDTLLSAKWKEHKVRRETTNKKSIVPKSNEGVKRGVKQDRGQGIVARHRNENIEPDQNVEYRNNGSSKQMKAKALEDSRTFATEASRSRGNPGQNPRGDSPPVAPAPVLPQSIIQMTAGDLLTLMGSKEKEKDKHRRPAKRTGPQSISKFKRHPSDSDGSFSDGDRVFDKVPPSESESAITNPDSSPTTESSEELSRSWTKPAPAEPQGFVYGC